MPDMGLLNSMKVYIDGGNKDAEIKLNKLKCQDSRKTSYSLCIWK